MKKLLVLIILALLLPSVVFADGMILPRPTKKTFDFTAIKEKQQYAVIEVLSNYFEKMNIFLSLTSLDYENHNITVVIPLKSVPQDVSGDKLNSSEFLKKYSFDDVEKLVEKQSFAGFVKKSAPQIRDALGEYIMLSLISPIYEISKFAFFPLGLYSSGFMGPAATLGAEAARDYEGVTHIATYEFEGATIDIYDVESGNTLEDFMKDYYDLYLPENVKHAVDTYKTHYIAILNTMIGPPGDVGLLKEYAPETFKDALSHVRANPEFTFTCYGYPYRYGVSRYPYTTCSPEQAIREKFSDYINRAKAEAASIQIGQTGNIEKLLYKDGNFIRLECTYAYQYFDGHACTGYVDLDLDKQTFVNKITIRHRNCLCSCGYGYCNEPTETKLITSKDNVNWNYIGADKPYSTIDWKEATFDINDNVRYVKISRGGGGCSRSDTDLDYVYIDGAQYYVSSTYLTGTTRVTESPIEKAMIEFFLSAYSNASNGMEISMTLPIKNSEIFYPLGTGIAWATPIEDTRILVEMDKSLDASFRNVQTSVIDDNNRYYLWSFKNWNPDFDITGTVGPSNFLTSMGDTGKLILESMNENSVILSVVFMIIIVIGAGLIVRYKGKGDLKRKTFFIILAIIFAPLISIWAVALLAYGLKTKPGKGELRENMINILIFLGILILAWVFMAVTSIIMGV